MVHYNVDLTLYHFSARWKVLLGFNCRNRLLLTGTPIQNSMGEVGIVKNRDYVWMLILMALAAQLIRLNFWYYVQFPSSCSVFLQSSSPFCWIFSFGPCFTSSCQHYLIHTMSSMNGFLRILRVMQRNSLVLMKVGSVEVAWCMLYENGIHLLMHWHLNLVVIFEVTL